ncbi:hypothetical protein [Fodinicola feengrottensis]
MIPRPTTRHIPRPARLRPNQQAMQLLINTIETQQEVIEYLLKRTDNLEESYASLLDKVDILELVTFPMACLRQDDDEP